MTGSLNLCQGRRSPVSYLDQRSPQGRRSPVFLSHDRVRSPNGFPSSSPTVERRSPTDRRSPTFSIQIQDRRSPVTTVPIMELSRRSPTSTVHVQDSRYDMTPEDIARTPTMGAPTKRSSIGLFTPVPFTEKRSPVTCLPIPPITVSNPSETCKIVERMAESTIEAIAELAEEAKHKEPEKEVPEKKEKTSVMREILAFVRKPSKKVTTRTGRFAAAFSRAESGSGSGPLIRQSTFSCSPAASSTAAKSAVTKQMSEVGFEPKMSLKFSLNTKMSLRLRRSTVTCDDKKKDKSKPSGDDTTPSSGAEAEKKLEQQVGPARSLPPIPFELENVHFEKVGESYIKHEQIREEPSEEGSPIKIVALSNENAQIDTVTEEKIEEEGSPADQKESELKPSSPRLHDRQQFTVPSSDDLLGTGRSTYDEEIRKSIEELRTEIEEHIKKIKPEPIYQNLLELRGEEGDQNTSPGFVPLQCPRFEIEPPSRRSSFDPPRSPFLENLRSPGVDTDTELMNLNRLDSGGDSFEMVDPDRNRESSFEDRYSSRDTSFDISRYQSTSYEDQTSSFEIVDIDIRTEDKKSNIDLRKSSIELVDPETFQKSGASSGRKSSLETHFDYNPADTLATSTGKAMFPIHGAKKAKTRCRDLHILPSPFTAFSRTRSPLSNQTSSNYSSRDSYDSSSSYQQSHAEQKSPYADPSRQHFPLTVKGHEEVRTFLCTDQRCASIFEPRPCAGTTSFLSGQPQPASMCEFEPPSPRRAASASPKHTFTFRIVLKKVDSSPDAICPSTERRSRERVDRFKRRDSRKKRLTDAGKSF